MNKKAYTIAELAEITSSKFSGDKDHVITGVNTLDLATYTEASFLTLSFLTSARYEEVMKTSQAGLVCVDEKIQLSQHKNYLVSKNPSKTFQKISELFLNTQPKTGFQGIHKTAVIHEGASIGNNVTICPYAVIDKDAVIKDNTTIGPFVYIGCGSQIGFSCFFHTHSVVREGSLIGDRVILQPGAVIGSCGFGYIPDEAGNHQKLEQIGIVILEDDVEIGANTTIDRARFKETIVRKGSKIDNLVQIAHNVEIGRSNIIAAQTGIAGSSKTGTGVMLGGQVGVLGHVKLADQVMVATRGGVSKSLLHSGKYRGSPAIAIHEYNRQEVHIRKLKKYADQIKELQKKVQELENCLDSENQ